MTTPTTMALAELSAKGADADLIKQTLQFALQRLMEMDVEALCKGADRDSGPRSRNKDCGGDARTHNFLIFADGIRLAVPLQLERQ